MKIGRCQKILQAHAWDIQENAKPAGFDPGKERHMQAWEQPRMRSEVAIKQLLQGYAAMATGYEETFEGSTLESDGYFSEHARDILKAARAWLNMGVPSRFENGYIDRLIIQLATASGFNGDEL